MPKVTTKSGKVKHLSYDKKGIAMAKKMKKMGMKVSYK